jgi:hypothetical protein
MENWKDIPGYEGLYQASNFGNIRTVEGKITSNKRYATRCWKSRVLKGRGDNPKTGNRVYLWKDGKPKDWLVARLVATTFLGDPPNGFTVNHKDGNRLNNRIDNLEWLSLADNIRHGFATGLYPQKPVTLVKDGQWLTFRSMARCDAFLGKHAGYTSARMQKFDTLVDANGNTYHFERRSTDERAD